MKKRGQVTVFIIIALLILIIGGILIYSHKKQTEIKPSALPNELMPVSNLIGGCLASLGQDAVKTLGMQSGYIYIPDDIKNNPKRHLKFAGFTLPYWYYDYESHIPDKAFIEKQISFYVNENLDKCLNDFKSLKMFNIKVLGEPETETRINDNNLIIILRYPMEITSGKSKRKADTFTATLNVRLGRVLKLAREIMASENEQAWLEQKTIDIMASNNEIPFTSLVFSCTPKIWKVDEVKNLTKHMLYANLPLIRIDHTKYRKFEKPIGAYESPSLPPSDMYEYSMFFWKNALQDDFSDMRVGFTYMPDWDMLFRVTPSSGNMMKSEHINPGSSNVVNLAQYCIQFYHFVYDVEYPVMVSIYDDKSFTKGYMFNFAFPVTVFGNWGIRNSRMPMEASAPETEEFCSDTGDKSYMVWVRDKTTFQDVPDAIVKYSCIKYECNLGKTDASGKLSFKLPRACKNGLIVVDKKGYLESVKQVTQDSMAVELKPLYKVTYTIRKYDNSTHQYYDIGSDEKAVLYMKSGNRMVYDVYGKSSNTIELTSGNYSIEIYLYKDNKLEGGYSGVIDVPEQPASAVFNAFIWPGRKQEDIYNLITSHYNSSLIKQIIR